MNDLPLFSGVPLPWSDPDGEALKDVELKAHEAAHSTELARLRVRLRALYFERVALGGSKAHVTADDAREFCCRWGYPTGPWLGAVFRGPGWVPDGWERSGWPGNHARRVRRWTFDREAVC